LPTFDGSTSVVALGEIVDLKLMLYQGMVSNGVTQAELSKRLKTSPTLVSRLLDLDHVSKAEQIRAAMDAIGVRSLVGYR
jgi:antitoxin HicB